jgi:hypothetical protein
MRERALQVPEDDVEPLRKLVNLDPSQRKTLLTSVKSATPDIHPDQFAINLGSETGVAAADLPGITSVLLSLYISSDRFGDTVEKFADAVVTAAEAADVRPADGSWDPFKGWLLEVLALHTSLGVSAKGAEIVRAFPNTFCSVRIISDIRPVFSHDAAAGPEAALVIHQARVTFHPDMGREHEHFYIAMDRDDLHRLRMAVDRALEKDRVLRSSPNPEGVRILEN